MRKIYQTKFGSPNGNCWAACLASCLELDLSDVPDFPAGHDDTSWWTDTQEWLFANHRLRLLEVEVGASAPLLEVFGPVYWVASGPSPRGNFNHAVVYFGGGMVHDPHPDQTGLRGPPKYGSIFIVADPAQSSSSRQAQDFVL